MGADIEEVGWLKLKSYVVGDIGVFDNGTRGIAGGRLLGSGPMTFLQMPQQNTSGSTKDADGDIKMTGANKVRAKWVSPNEIKRRRKEGLCIRCGNKGHRIAGCQFLPAERPQTAVRAIEEQQLEDVFDINLEEKQLKD